jgi:hypothetical protein
VARNPTQPGETTIKTLFGLSNNLCAFRDIDSNDPACEEVLVDPKWKQVKARVCHIRAASPGGPRYDSNMKDAERSHFDNLILLCPNHHTLVDDLEPDRFSVQALRTMKEAALSDTLWANEQLLNRATRALIITIEHAYAAGPLPSYDMSVTEGPIPANLTASVHIDSTVDGSLSAGVTMGATASLNLSDQSLADDGLSAVSPNNISPDRTPQFDSVMGPKTLNDDNEGQRRAAALQVLLNSKGYSNAQVNGWWYAPSPELGGLTPLFAWQRHSDSDRNDVESLAATMPSITQG